MSRKPQDLIPPSPSEADHAVRAVEADVLDGEDPFPLFARWFEEAARKEPSDANAMSLATVDPDGLPDVRTVLLKGVDHGGFAFYTNLQSAKGGQLAANPQAALLFHWKSLGRQVRVRGPVSAVGDAEADAYFSSRARSSQIGAWASKQSRPLEGPLALEQAVARFTAKFGLGEPPRPLHWSGFRLVPVAMEFWREGRFRLHQRLAFQRSGPSSAWRRTRLYP